MEQAKEMIQRLIEWNTQKISLLEKVLDYSKQQQLAISSNSLNALLDVIKKKQEVMDEIDIVDRNFYEVFMELKELLNVVSMDQIHHSDYPEILELKATIRSVMTKLESIDSLDKNNLSTIKNEIDKVKEQMRETKNQKKASQGYRVVMDNYGINSQGFYIDGKK